MGKFEKEPNGSAMIQEGSDEETFRAYMEDLRLMPGDFDKKILDIGAGAAKFARWAREHKVSSRIFSLDHNPDVIKGEKAVAGKAETLPFADNTFDLVISRAAIPNVYGFELRESRNPKEVKEKVLKSLTEAIRVLKPGGEIRLTRVFMGDVYDEYQTKISGSTESALGILEEKFKVEITKEEIHRREEGRGLYLIIIKKPR